MFKFHIANTFFELELETDPVMSLSEAFRQHAVFRQLQFIPFLYAAKQDRILLSDLPPIEYANILRSNGLSVPNYSSLEEKDFSPESQIISWGPSRLIAQWAERRSLIYRIPAWDVVKRVNSKHFSFVNSPKLPHAMLLQEEIQAKEWLRSFDGPKVLKTCFGVSGKGHLIIDNETAQHNRIFSFLIREWSKGLPVIAEPWVERKLDFSTQWEIDMDKTIRYIGSTLCENDARGQYRLNAVGDEETLFQNNLPFLLDHKKKVEPVLQHIAALGFFGNVGVDAMLYFDLKNKQELHLHPIVEINARKTMGWAALQFQRRYFPNQLVKFTYTNGESGYLPEFVESKQGKNVIFSRNLTINLFK